MGAALRLLMTQSRRWGFGRGVLQMQRGRSRDIGPDSRSDALCAATVGNRGKPSGESGLIPQNFLRLGTDTLYQSPPNDLIFI